MTIVDQAAQERRILRQFAEGRNAEGIAITYDTNAIQVMHIVRKAVAAHVNGAPPTAAAVVVAPRTPDVIAPPPAPAGDRLADMLTAAAASTSPRTRRQGERLDTAAAALAEVLADEKAAVERAAAAEAERKAAADRLAKARAELQAAEAALRQAGGKPAGKVRAATPRGSGRPDPKAVRTWAAANGVAVADRGSIAQDVVDRYLAAQLSVAA